MPALDSTEKLSLSVPEVYLELMERAVRGGELYNCCSPGRGVNAFLSSESITQLQEGSRLSEISAVFETDRSRWGKQEGRRGIERIKTSTGGAYLIDMMIEEDINMPRPGFKAVGYYEYKRRGLEETQNDEERSGA
jgi:hypothetical protein